MFGLCDCCFHRGQMAAKKLSATLCSCAATTQLAGLQGVHPTRTGLSPRCRTDCNCYRMMLSGLSCVLSPCVSTAPAFPRRQPGLRQNGERCQSMRPVCEVADSFLFPVESCLHLCGLLDSLVAFARPHPQSDDACGQHQ